MTKTNDELEKLYLKLNFLCNDLELRQKKIIKSIENIEDELKDIKQNFKKHYQTVGLHNNL